MRLRRSGDRPAAPDRAARRGSWRSAEFVSLDFETTGLDYDRDEIVSFGALPVRGGRIVVGEARHRLVSPGVPASVASMKVHEILPRDLVGAPPLSEARAELSGLLAGRFLLAWFAEVEIAFLARVFDMPERAWRGRTVDVRQIVLSLEHLGQATRNTLSSTAARYGVPVTSPHEALDDALVTAQLFLILATRMEAAGRGRVTDLLALRRRRH